MKSIEVHSLPIYEVIKDIARCFGDKALDNCDEYKVYIPEHLGKGTIRGTSFEHGIGFIHYNVEFYEDMEIRFIMDDVHPLKFLNCLEGHLEHHFEDNHKMHLLEKFQNLIVASSDKKGHILKFKEKVKTDLISVEVIRHNFRSKMGCELETMSENIQRLFKDYEAENSFFYQGYYSLDVAQMFKKIVNFKESDFLNKMHMEGMIYEILTNQLIQYQNDFSSTNNGFSLRNSELKLINKAAEVIEDDVTKFSSVYELAVEVGINVNKLQQGFRQLFDLTVNGYVQKVRLEKAKILLEESQFNLGEIVEKIGLINQSYFSKFFKEKYGISPSTYRKNHKSFVSSDIEK